MPWTPGPGPTDGDDTFTGTSGVDSGNAGLGNDTMEGFGGDDELSGGDGNDTLRGGDGNDDLAGGAGNDIVEGGAGDDLIEGFLGIDWVDGGAGDDTVNVYSGTQSTHLGGSGYDTVRFLNAELSEFVAAVNGFEATLGGTIRGTAQGNTFDLSGLAGSVGLIVSGGGGQDFIFTSDGNDELSGDEGDDFLWAGLGLDVVHGGDGLDTLIVQYGALTSAVTMQDFSVSLDGPAEHAGRLEVAGSATTRTTFDGIAAFQITTGSGADNIFTGRGNDFLNGGGGNDVLKTGEGADRLFGGAGDDDLDGGPGADRLDGGTGRDSMKGGPDSDTYVVDNSFDTVVELSGEGAADLVEVLLPSYTAAANVERLVGARGISGQVLAGNGLDNVISIRPYPSSQATSPSNTLWGGDGNDALTGARGGDVLRGGTGNDVLDGAGGLNDIADYRDKTTAVVVNLTGASDAVVYVGGVVEDTVRNVEFVYGGSGADILVGDVLANVLAGGGGNDKLIGGGGLDLLDGGSSSGDTVSFETTTGAVILTLNGAVIATATIDGDDADRVLNVENVVGGSNRDVLRGDANVNRLEGAGGDDRLIGGPGLDRLDGGDGTDDVALYTDETAPITVTLRGALDATIFVGGVAADIVRNVEGVWGGSAADVLTGDAGRNHLNGFGGDDILKGGGGGDLLIGLGGFDIADYREKITAVAATPQNDDNTLVSVGGAPEDVLNSIEGIYGGSAADQLIGNKYDNLFRGGAGADAINGFGGVDTVDFRDKTSTVQLTLAGSAIATATVGGVAEDTVRNIEIVQGGAASDRLTGDVLDNQLFGNGGNDLLRGGRGADLLFGGPGADTFFFNALAESSVAATGRDTVRDFRHAQGDRIYLAAIDANTTLAGDQAFTLGAVGTAGRLQITALNPLIHLVQGDVNGGGADFAILVYSATALVGADFVL